MAEGVPPGARLGLLPAAARPGENGSFTEEWNNQSIYEGALQSFVVDQFSYVSTPGRPGTSSSPADPHDKSPLKQAGLQVP